MDLPICLQRSIEDSCFSAKNYFVNKVSQRARGTKKAKELMLLFVNASLLIKYNQNVTTTLSFPVFFFNSFFGLIFWNLFARSKVF